MRLMPDWPVWRTRAVIEVPSVGRFWGRQASAVLACVLRQVRSASIGKRSLMAVAAGIIPLAAIVALMGISIKDGVAENRFIGRLPPPPPAASPQIHTLHTPPAPMGRTPASVARTLSARLG